MESSECQWIVLGGMLTGNADAMEMHRKGFIWQQPEHEKIAHACCVAWAMEDWSQVPCHEIPVRRDAYLAELGFAPSGSSHWFEACIGKFWEWANSVGGGEKGKVK